MKILVTGGAGFIGSHIVDEYIENGHDVVVLDNMKYGNIENINNKAKLYKLDIRDKSIDKIFEKEKFDVVCHHAAQISVSNSISDPIEDADININGTLNILECCRRNSVKKIIYPASAAIFGEPKYLPVDENHPLDMQCGYGVSKHTVEHYLEVYSKLYGLKYTVFRYANVYGPRQSSKGEGGVVAIFSEKFLEKEIPVIYGDGNQTRDFVYVKDVAKANLIALKSLDNDIFNVCSGIEISINKLVSIFKKITNSSIEVLNKEERKGDIKFNYMSYEKIGKVCSWKPTYSLENGIENTINYYKNKDRKLK